LSKEESLTRLANEVRQDIITMLVEAGSGHPAGSLGMADIFVALYFKILKIDPAKPHWSGRDRVVLSCGHIVPVLYATLARKGYFSMNELKTLRQINSRLQGHPYNLSTTGIDATSGSLGQGLSQAVGMAIAGKADKSNHHIFCIMSDAEQQEGQVWEAAMFAGGKKIDNLIAIIDRNHIQTDGDTEDVVALEPLVAKYRAFGWSVGEIDGHDFDDIIDACAEAKATRGKPSLIIANTISGKGVSFMEGDYHWHGTPPTPEEAIIALRELRSLD